MQNNNILPGLNISLGCSLLYICLLIFIPLAALVINAANISWEGFVKVVTSPRILHAFLLSFECSIIAAFLSVIIGTTIAWIIIRYQFFGREIFDALIDLPFAIPTAVAGIALTNIYAPSGIIGSFFAKYGITIAFTPIGIVIALIFVSLPFVVRTVEPVLRNLDIYVEEAALSLGASPIQIFCKIIFPNIISAIVTAFALALSRGLGEYGSVIFIAGNIPSISEIVPILIVIKMEEYDFQSATVIASIMLFLSFAILFFLNNIKRHAK